MKVFIIAILSCISILVSATRTEAQEDKSKRPSPPAEVKSMVGDANVAVYYSSPAVKERQIWGGLVPYGKVWRTGANEATVFESDKDLMIGGKRLPAGKYALFTIPTADKWTFIFNSDWDQWGAFKYDATKDVLRYETAAAKSPVFNERLKFTVEDNNVIMHWENLNVGFPISQ